jgi:hypothetical protein
MNNYIVYTIFIIQIVLFIFYFIKESSYVIIRSDIENKTNYTKDLQISKNLFIESNSIISTLKTIPKGKQKNNIYRICLLGAFIHLVSILYLYIGLVTTSSSMSSENIIYTVLIALNLYPATHVFYSKCAHLNLSDSGGVDEIEYILLNIVITKCLLTGALFM